VIWRERGASVVRPAWRRSAGLGTRLGAAGYPFALPGRGRQRGRLLGPGRAMTARADDHHGGGYPDSLASSSSGMVPSYVYPRITHVGYARTPAAAHSCGFPSRERGSHSTYGR